MKSTPGNADDGTRAPSLSRASGLIPSISGSRLLAGTLALLVAGALLFGAPSPAQPGNPPRPGGWALDAAFSASLVVAVWIVFRATDLIFRDAGAHVLAALPVPGRSLALNRALHVVRDGALAGAIPALLFAGGTLATADAGHVLATVHVATSSLLTAILAATATPLALQVMLNRPDGSPQTGSSAASAVAMAPGAALAIAGGASLMLKLALGEIAVAPGLQTPGATLVQPATLLGLGICIVLVLAAALPGAVTLSTRYRTLLAVHQATSRGLLNDDDEWVSQTSLAPSLTARSLPADLAAICSERAAALRRSRPFARILDVVVALLGGAALVLGAANPIVTLSVPLLASVHLTLFMRTASRVYAHGESVRTFEQLMAGRAAPSAATRWSAVSEASVSAFPWLVAGIVSLVLRDASALLAAVCWATASTQLAAGTTRRRRRILEAYAATSALAVAALCFAVPTVAPPLIGVSVAASMGSVLIALRRARAVHPITERGAT